ncbi:serine-threonine protein kinase, PKc-like superfamily [Lymphocystis disease virus 3]|uniref:Serine-threonine protein kinase, PKc-like superfamily n=1 Tax=Lymphocystis disease virus 3 TaxID=2560566 RepID=A0A1B2RW81_9VIRU|nr:serine-threonine protein kinase, PKc-like superfamily [Lymphocystis disease virus Sa]AOC55247.1 serine-threonine protein kinase, PKc-like superfamily [Lymphocystis disease virus 3]
MSLRRRTQLIESMTVGPKERGKKLSFDPKVKVFDGMDHPQEGDYRVNKPLSPFEEARLEQALNNMTVSAAEETIDDDLIGDPVPFLLEDRLDRFADVRGLFKSDKSDKWNYCVSVNSKFKQSLDAYKFIGRGSYGNVYRVSYNDNVLVVKETLLQRDVNEEITCARLAAEILELKYVPNLIYVFKTAFCKECVISLNKSTKTGRCYVIIMESLDRSIGGLNINQGQLESGLLQLLLTLSVLHGQYGIVHRDIKASNILIKSVPPGGCWKYEIAGRTFYVPNYGLVFLLADFGLSTIYHPVNNETAFYGTRNAHLTSSGNPLGWGPAAGTEIVINPFNSLINPDGNPNNNVVQWKSGDYDLGYYTVNKLTAQNYMSIQNPVDLNDMRAFPAWEFMGDIYDLLRTFTGGNKFFQAGNHKGFTSAYPRQAVYFDAQLHPDFIYNSDGRASRFLLADVSAAYLFPETSIERSDVLETYEWPK